MSYIIRTAAVTQKSANKEFNGDNLNLNGKVLSMENADKGFKGAGSMNVPFALAFASSDYNGFAGAALTALNDRLAGLKEDENGFSAILDGYFADSKSALEKCGCDSNGLATAVLAGYENKIVAAKMGAVCVLRYADGDLSLIGSAAQDEATEAPACSCNVIEEINNGDLFVLCSANVLESLTEGEIIVALNAADGSEKKAVQMLASKYAKRNPDANVTFTVVRIVKEQEAPAVAAAAPVAQPEAPVYDEPQAEENVYDPESEEYEEDDEPADPRKKILLWVILAVALLLVMAATTFAAYKITWSRNHADVSAGVVVSGGNAQYDVNAEQPSEAPSTEAATEEATEEATEAATEEATEEPTQAETTTEEDDDDYYYDEDEEDDDDNGYYDDEEDATTVEPVTRPVQQPDPTEPPTEAPTEAPVVDPTSAPDDGGEEEPSILYPAPDDNENGGVFEES